MAVSNMQGRETLFSKLNPGVINHLEKHLLLNDAWKHLAAKLKNRKGGQKYDAVSIMVLDQRNTQPSREILRSLITDNTNVGTLIERLREASLYSLANYLSVDVLGESSKISPPQPQEQIIPAAKRMPLDTEDLPGPPKPRQHPVSPPIHQPVEHTELPTANDSNDETPTYISSKLGDQTYVDITICSNYISGNDKQTELLDGNPGTSCDESPSSESGLFKHIAFSLLEKLTNNFNNRPFDVGGNLIGKGGFSRVYIAILPDGTRAAVKRLKEIDQSYQKQFHTEIHVLSKFDHENLLPLIGFSEDGPEPCIVTPFMSNGSLEDMLAGKGDLTVYERIHIAKGTARGICYLHTAIKGSPIIHRDVKSANILLDSNYTAKVADLGIARQGAVTATNSFVTRRTDIAQGTTVYMAPETLEMKLTVKMDCYSYGVVLLELLTGLPAYDPNREDPGLSSHVQETCEDVMDIVDIRAGNWKDAFAQFFYDVSLRCLEPSYKRRPALTELLPEIDEWPEEC